MHRISRAPVLSATRSRVSCWITSISYVCQFSGGKPAGAWRNVPPGSRRTTNHLARSRISTTRHRLVADSGRVSISSTRSPTPHCFSSCAFSLLVRRGGKTQLALPHDRVDPGDLPPDDLQPPVVVQLAGGALDPEVEQLRLGLAQLHDQVLIGQLAQLRGPGARCHQTSTPSRLTMRHFIGSLWIARRIASRAVCSLGNDISNRIRPGLTLATHHSGEPLPEPIRVSAGFFVMAWSGKMVIQTLPPRRICRVMAIRADSICRLVTYAGSSAWMPKSPNATRVPPFAEPCRSGWCGLRKPL